MSKPITDVEALQDLKEMLAQGMDVNALNENGENPLTFAVKNDWPQCVQYLIDQKADVALENKDKDSPLWISIYEGHHDCSRILLAAGANPNKESYNLIWWALKEDGRNTILESIVKPLIAAGCEIDGECLWLAASHGSFLVRALLKGGASVNSLGPDYSPPILGAADRGLPLVLRLLIAAGADVNAEDKWGNTAIKIAFRNNHPECIRLLYEAGADLSLLDQSDIRNIKKRLDNDTFLRDDPRPWHIKKRVRFDECCQLMLGDNRSPASRAKSYAKGSSDVSTLNLDLDFLEAAAVGDLQTLQKAVEAGVNVNVKSDFDRTALHLSAEHDHLECVKYLVQSGANINAVDDSSTSVISFSLYGSMSSFEYLLAAGADLTLTDDFDNETILFRVANKPDYLRKLVDAGCNIHHMNVEGETAILKATSNIECMEILFQAGAESKITNNAGNTLLHKAAADKDGSQTVQWLLDKGFDPNVKNKHGKTPLHKSRHVNITELLIQSGAKVNIRDTEYRETPLHAAVSDGKIDIIQCLLKHGANVQALDKYKRTPLHKTREADVAQLLIAANADVNAKDKYGETPLYSAVDNYFSNKELVRCLLMAGADPTLKDNEGISILKAAEKNRDVLGLIMNHMVGDKLNQLSRTFGSH